MFSALVLMLILLAIATQLAKLSAKMKKLTVEFMSVSLFLAVVPLADVTQAELSVFVCRQQ